MKRKLSPSMFLSLALVAGIAALAWAGWKSYSDWANKALPVEDGRMDAVSAMLPQELRAMFGDSAPSASQQAAIAQKNLFSPERRAWTAPQKVEEPPPSTSEQEQPPPPGSIGVRLYGTTISNDNRAALLYFERFSSKQKHRFIAEGETAQDEGENGLFYVLKSLEPDKAVLEDPQGREYTIGLYEHQRTAPPRPEPRPQAPASAPAPAPAAAPGPAAAPVGAEPIRSMQDIPESQAEREQLVREGRLRRLDTPFGPVYRPVE